jgi:hypothetical protein
LWFSQAYECANPLLFLCVWQGQGAQVGGGEKVDVVANPLLLLCVWQGQGAQVGGGEKADVVARVASFVKCSLFGVAPNKSSTRLDDFRKRGEQIVVKEIVGRRIG